jgi:hypothetical protein
MLRQIEPVIQSELLLFLPFLLHEGTDDLRILAKRYKVILMVVTLDQEQLHEEILLDKNRIDMGHNPFR